MAADSIGSVSVSVVPDAEGWVAKLESQILPQSSALGEQAGARFAAAFSGQLRGIDLPGGSPLSPERQAAKGSLAGDAFGKSYASRIDAALRSLPDAKVTADSSEADKKVADLRARLADLRGSIALGINDDLAQSKLAAIQAQLRALSGDSADIRIKTDAAQAAADLDKAKTSASEARQQFSLIQDVVVPLAPAVVTLGGAAAGAGAGLVGLGAAGLLAFKGISAEMKTGTALGSQYTAGINTLMGDLSSLEHTAAAGIVTPFNAAVKDMNGLLPFANQQVGILSADLGQIGVSVLTGVISGLRNFGPLLDDVAARVAQVSQAFESWASGPGGAKFAVGLQSAFDQAVPAVTALADAGTHVISALAPLGSTTLTAVTAISQAIAAIPTPVLTTLAEVLVPLYEVNRLAGYFGNLKSALSGLAESKLAASVLGDIGSAVKSIGAGFSNAGAVSGFGSKLAAVGAGAGEAAVALGPMGLVVGGVTAALGLGIGALASYQAHQAAIAQEASSLTQILTENSGALGVQGEQAIASALANTKAATDANQLGISMSTVKGYLEGNTGAQKALTDQLVASGALIDKNGQLTLNYAQAQQDGTVATNANADAAGDLLGILNDNESALGKAVTQWQNYSQFLDAATNASQDEWAANKTTQDSFTQLAAQTGMTSAQVQNYASVLGISSDAVKSGATTNGALASAVEEVSTAASTAGPAVSALLSQMQTFGQSAGTAADKAQLFGAELQAGFGDALSTDQTVADLYHNIDGLKDAFTQAGKGALDFRTGAIDLANVNAGPFLDSLQGVQQGLIKAFEAQDQYNVSIGQDGPTAAKNAIDYVQGSTSSIQNQIVAFQDQARAAGVSNDAIAALTAKYFNIPPELVTKIEQQGGETVTSILDQIGQLLAKFTGQTWIPGVGLDTSKFDVGAGHVQAVNDHIDGMTPTPAANLDTGAYDAHAAHVANNAGQLAAMRPTPVAGMNTGPFDASAGHVAGTVSGLNTQTAFPTADLRDNASAAIQNVAANLNALNGRHASTYVDNYTTNYTTAVFQTQGKAVLSANGNILNGAAQVQHFAAGGFENHVAQIAPAGAMRLWAEPETGGEAYIPLGQNKRDRSEHLLGQVAGMFGDQLVTGDTHNTSSTDARRQTTNHNSFTITAPDASSAAESVARRLEIALS